jgi:hypothetical protein
MSKRVLYHEAAHLVIAKNLNFVITNATVVSDSETYGHVSYDWESDNCLSETIYVHLAGAVVEKFIFGSYEMTCAGDIKKAQDGIRELIEYGYSPYGPKYILSNERKCELEEEIDDLLKKYFIETEKMVFEHMKEIDIYVGYLSKYRYLTERDVFLIDNNHSYLLFLKREWFKFAAVGFSFMFIKFLI